MKYLVLLAVLLAVYLLWRVQRPRPPSGDGAASRPNAATPALPQDMVRCPVCAVHLPKADAVGGTQGRLYCSGEHRRLGER